MTPMCFLGETITAPTATEKHLRAGAVSGMSALTMGAIGAGIGHIFSKPSNRTRYQKNGALAGAIVGAVQAGMLETGFMCGLFSSEEEQKEIDRVLRPKRLLVAAAGVGAVLVGGSLGSKASKKHPTAGRLVGAALSSGAVAALIGETECPPSTTGGPYR